MGTKAIVELSKAISRAARQPRVLNLQLVLFRRDISIYGSEKRPEKKVGSNSFWNILISEKRTQENGRVLSYCESTVELEIKRSSSGTDTDTFFTKSTVSLSGWKTKL